MQIIRSNGTTVYESFSHYVTADILVFQNKETAAMLEHTEYPEKIFKAVFSC